MREAPDPPLPRCFEPGRAGSTVQPVNPAFGFEPRPLRLRREFRRLAGRSPG